MNKKLIFLFVAFLLPGLIYTFLKVFGSNSFYVVPLFQTEVSVPVGCPEVKTPYLIPQHVLSSLIPAGNKDSLFLVFYKIDEAKLGSTSGNLQEIQKQIAPEGDGVSLIKIKSDTLGLNCALLLAPVMDIVLLDRDNRIRGQYASEDREEVDRLGTELDIILKKY